MGVTTFVPSNQSDVVGGGGGTPAAPAILPDRDDTDTGLLVDSPDTLEIATGGFTRVTFTGTVITIHTPNLVGATTVLQSFGWALADHDSDFTMNPASTGTVRTNAGSSGTVTGSLPTATFSGAFYTFIVEEANEFRILPQAGDRIIDPDLPGLMDGEYIHSSTPGSTLTIMALTDKNWIVVAKTGTWSEAVP